MKRRHSGLGMPPLVLAGLLLAQLVSASPPPNGHQLHRGRLRRRHGDLRNSSPPAVTLSRVSPKTYPIDSISGQAIAQSLTDA